MFRRNLIAIVTAMTITAAPLYAQGWPQLTKENVGKGVGAVAGALLGSQIGGGRGQLAAVAAGTLAGYWVGGNVGRYLSQADRAGISQATNQAIYSGQPVSWSNPDTGAQTRVSVRDVSGHSSNWNLKPALVQLPPVELINAFFSPSANINVRGGPGTDYAVVHRIAAGNPVPVIGKVLNNDWYLIAENGSAAGFVYSPLMKLARNLSYTDNAIRHASAGHQVGRYVAQNNTCRVITQNVRLQNGQSDTTEFRACQQADGNWVKA